MTVTDLVHLLDGGLGQLRWKLNTQLYVFLQNLKVTFLNFGTLYVYKTYKLGFESIEKCIIHIKFSY